MSSWLVLRYGLPTLSVELPPQLLTVWFTTEYLCSTGQLPVQGGVLAFALGIPAASFGPLLKNSRRVEKRVISSRVTRRMGMVLASQWVEWPNLSSRMSSATCLAWEAEWATCSASRAGSALGASSASGLAFLTTPAGGASAILVMPSSRTEGCWLMGMQS